MTTRLTRRDFVGGLAAGGLALSAGGHAAAADLLPGRVIPGTDEKLPVVGLGSTKAVMLIPSEGTDPVESVIRELMQQGGRVVDTGPRTVDIDRDFGLVLQKPDVGDRLFLAVKVNTSGRDAGIAQFRQSLRLFGRQSFDLVQIQSLTDLDRQWDNLRQFKDDGQARYIGVTVSDESLYGELEAFMRRERPDFVQINYSVVEHSAEQRLLPLARDLGTAVLVNRPFSNGDYFGLVKNRSLPDWTRAFDCGSWADFSLKYILANPAVTCVLTETANPKHMRQNIAAAFGRLPDEAARERMRELASDL